MRYLIFSDVHDNYDALSLLPEDYDHAAFCGDLCEDDPGKARKCIDRLSRMHGLHVVLGAHDQAIIDDKILKKYVRYAEVGREPKKNMKNASNALKMRTELGSEYIKWLEKWKKPVLKTSASGYKIIMVHDCLVPLTGKESQQLLGLGGYNKSRMVSTVHAAKNFNRDEFDLLIHGHIHYPQVWSVDNKKEVSDVDVSGHIFNNDEKIELFSKKRYILCPGSMCGDSGNPIVGFNGDISMSERKISYAIFETDELNDDIIGSFKVKFQKIE